MATKNLNHIRVGLALFRLSTHTRQETVEKRLTKIKEWGFNAAEIHFLGNRLGPPNSALPHYPHGPRTAIIGQLLEGMAISIHSPYEMSLTVNGKKQRANTKAHFTYNFRLGDLLGATHFTFHPGSLKNTITYSDIKSFLLEIMENAHSKGYTCLPAPEVAGKVKGFGDFYQSVDLAADCGTLLCWDIAHDYARGGDVTSEQGILNRLDYLEDRFPLKDHRLPIHLSGIQANRTGEVRHTLLAQGSGVPGRLVLSVLKEQGWTNKIVVICESRATEEDWAGQHPSVVDAQRKQCVVVGAPPAGGRMLHPSPKNAGDAHRLSLDTLGDEGSALDAADRRLHLHRVPRVDAPSAGGRGVSRRRIAAGIF